MSRLSTGSRRSSSTSITSRPGSRLSISHPNADLKIGDAVSVISSGLSGIVRYSGPTEFSNGHWIGLELELAAGKNDGSVEGHRYFTCKQGHGMFIRAAQLQTADISSKKSPRVITRSLRSSEQQEPAIAPRYSDTKDIPIMKKTAAVSPRLTRSRAAKSAAVSAIEETALAKKPRSKSVGMERKQRASSKSKIKPGELEDIKEGPVPSDTQVNTKSQAVETSKEEPPKQEAYLRNSSSPRVQISDKSIQLNEKENGALATNGTGKKFQELEKSLEIRANGLESSLEHNLAPLIHNNAEKEITSGETRVVNCSDIITNSGIPTPRKKCSEERNSASKTIATERINTSANSKPKQNSTEHDILPKSRGSSTRITAKAVKSLKIQDADQFASIRAEVVQQLRESDTFYASDVGSQSNEIRTEMYSNKLPQPGIPTLTKSKLGEGVKERLTIAETPKSSFNPIYDDLCTDSLLAKKKNSSSDKSIEKLDPAKRLQSSGFLTTVPALQESQSAGKLATSIDAKKEILSTAIDCKLLETISKTIPLDEDRVDQKSYPESKPSESLRGNSSKIVNRKPEKILHTEENNLLSFCLDSTKNFVPDVPKTPNSAKVLKKLTRQSTLQNEEIFNDEETGLGASFIKTPILSAQNSPDFTNSEVAVALEQTDEETLRIHLKKLQNKNAVLLNEKLILEKNLVNSSNLHREEIAELKKQLKNKADEESIKEQYDILLNKYESAKLDISNSHLYQERLQGELKQFKQELRLLQEEIQVSKDSAEMTVIDKCVLEEELEKLREEMQILADQNEELMLQIELESLKPVQPNVKALADKHQLSVLNNRLSEALVKLRDAALAREAELKDKIKVRDLDIARLKCLSDDQIEMEKNLKKANEHIDLLKTQIEDAKDSNQLIAALTESNLNLDENLARKTLETLELEQLRKINNQLEEAHKTLESHLYQDLQLKEIIIQELVDRYTAQEALRLKQEEQIQKMLNEKLENENKPKENMIDAAELELMNQQLRVLKTSIDEKRAQVQRSNLDLTSAREDIQLLLDCVEYVLDSNIKKRIRCYFVSKILRKKCELLLSAPEFSDASALQIIVNVHSCSTGLKVITEYCVIENDAIFADAVAGNPVLLLDEIAEKLEIGDFESCIGTLSSLNWFVDKYSPITTALFATKEMILVKAPTILELISSKCEALKKLFSYHGSSPNALSEINLLKEASGQVYHFLISNLENDMALTSVSYGELLALYHQFDSFFTELLGHFRKNVEAEHVSSFRPRIENFRAELERFLHSSLEPQPKPKFKWQSEAEAFKSRVELAESLQKSLALLKTKFANQKHKADEQIGAYSLKIEFLEKKLDSIDILKAQLYNTKQELETIEDLKNKYVQALEAAHADLKDAEFENEELRRAAQSVQTRANASPRKSYPVGPNSRSVQDAYDDDGNQTNSLRYLLAENSRLRSLHYGSIISEIFDPSDPVMKLGGPKHVSHGESDLGSINTLLERARILSASFTSVINFPKIVDITQRGKAAGANLLKALEDQKRNAAALAKEFAAIQDKIKYEFSVPPSVNYDEIGEIILPSVKGASITTDPTIRLEDWKQLKRIHDSLLI